MNKRFILTFVFTLFLFSFASASVDFENDTYTIDTWVPTWLGSDGESTIRLVDNTDTCLIDCESTLEFHNEKPVNLLDGFVFQNRVGTDVGSKVEDLEFLVGQYQDVEKDNYSLPIYSDEEVCYTPYLNETNETEECYYPVIGYEKYTTQELIYRDYNGEEIEGLAYLKIKGQKKIGYDVDWIIEFRGQELTEWAWWDNDYKYKREITGLTGNISALYNISYNSNMQSDFDDIRFVDSTENTQLNYSIINKVDSSYAQVRINNLAESSVYMYYGNSAATDNSDYGSVIFEPVSAYTFDVNANDDVGSNDGTVNGATHITSGKISGAYDFDGLNDYIEFTGVTPYSDNTDFSLSLWVYFDGISGSQILYSEGSTVSSSPIYILQKDSSNHLSLYIRDDSNSAKLSVSGTTTLSAGQWYHIVYTDDGGTYKLFLDNNEELSGTYTQGTLTTTRTTLGTIAKTPLEKYFNGKMDEVGIWNTALTSTEIGKLYTMNLPSFTVDSEEQNSQILVYLNNPTNGQEFTNKSIYFNCNATSPTGVYQLNFSIDGVLNQTVTGTGLTNLTFSDVLDLSDGNHNYTCAAYDDSGSINATKTFSIDTTPFIEFTESNPINNSNTSEGYFQLFVKVNTTYLDNITVNVYNDTGQKIEVSKHPNSSYPYYQYLVPTNPLATPVGGGLGTYKYNATIFTTTGQQNSTETRYINVDYTAPEINITSPLNNYDYLYEGLILDLNYNITDPHLDSCWYNYNGVNYSLDCVTNTTTFNYTLDANNVTIYANDTFGNTGNSTKSWTFKVTQGAQLYSETARSGNLETYYTNITMGDGYELASSKLIYEGEEVNPIIYSAGNLRALKAEYVPLTTENTNYTFYWEMTLTDGTVFNSTTNTQYVTTIFLDNCSNYTYELFNLTLLDENTQDALLGDIELSFILQNKPYYQTVNTRELELEGVSSTRICSDVNLTDENFAYSAEIRYSADDYAAELYHIQRADLDDEVDSYILYDLPTNDTTEFKVTYQDSNFEFIPDAVIQLQRKYISEGVYKVVEAPLTSDDGTAVLHIDLDSIKYKATVVKNGEILNTFDNIVFVCDSELTGECTQKLLGEVDSINDIDYNIIRDFGYSISEEDNDVTVDFTIPSTSSSSVNIVLTQIDQFGNERVCNKTVISSAGSIECDFNDTIGDSYLTLEINKDNYPMAIKSYKMLENGRVDFLDNNYLIVLVLLFSVVGMALTSPEWMIMNGIITLVLASAIYLINGFSFAMGTSLILWLLIAAGILIFKLAKQEDR